MIYRLVLDSEEGKTYFFNGINKLVHDDHAADLWNDTTTLFVTMYGGADDQGPVMGKGVLKIQPQDFTVQMGTMQVFNVDNDQERLQWLLRVGEFFTGSLFDSYGPVAAKPNRMDPTKPPARKKRPLRMNAPEIYYPMTSDNVQLRLTRYRGGTKGPVMMSPGFGVSTMSFSTDTVDTNLPEYLYAKGYDVWLFDYRASPDLPSASTMFSLDDIAQKDYPVAVAKVLEITGAKSLQVIAHCVGSMTSHGNDVRIDWCAVRDLFSAGPVPGDIDIQSGQGRVERPGISSRIGPEDRRHESAAKRLAECLSRRRDSNVSAKGTLQEFGLPSGSNHLRRKLPEHDQLNEATHDALYEMFGVSNIRTFAHILKAIQKGNVVDEKGNDTYMPNVAKLKIPITFIQGADNELFLPPGTDKTFRYVCEKNGSDGYQLVSFANYGHMDCFVGKTAVTDIYPTLAAHHLDVGNPADGNSSGTVPPATNPSTSPTSTTTPSTNTGYQKSGAQGIVRLSVDVRDHRPANAPGRDAALHCFRPA